MLVVPRGWLVPECGRCQRDCVAAVRSRVIQSNPRLQQRHRLRQLPFWLLFSHPGKHPCLNLRGLLAWLFGAGARGRALHKLRRRSVPACVQQHELSSLPKGHVLFGWVDDAHTLPIRHILGRASPHLGGRVSSRATGLLGLVWQPPSQLVLARNILS